MTTLSWQAIRPVMVKEMSMYFGEFLRGDRGFDQFLNADFNFVTPGLALHQERRASQTLLLST